MHGPEHHVMVGAALLTAYKNAGGDIDLHSALIEMLNRGKKFQAVLAVFGELAEQGSALGCLSLSSRNLRR